MRTAKIGPDLRLTCLPLSNPGDINGSCRHLTTYCSSYWGGEFNTKQIASFFTWMCLIPWWKSQVPFALVTGDCSCQERWLDAWTSDLVFDVNWKNWFTLYAVSSLEVIIVLQASNTFKFFKDKTWVLCWALGLHVLLSMSLYWRLATVYVNYEKMCWLCDNYTYRLLWLWWERHIVHQVKVLCVVCVQKNLLLKPGEGS